MNAAEMKVLHEEADTARPRLLLQPAVSLHTSECGRRRGLIEAGRLGTIYHAKATWVRSRGIPQGVGGWFTEKKRSGGGALIDIGVHALDSAWYLMGNPRPLAVSAQVYRNFEHLVQDPVFDVEDAGVWIHPVRERRGRAPRNLVGRQSPGRYPARPILRPRDQ
jgi:hypothetical protein